jgi:hypothetical protein
MAPLTNNRRRASARSPRGSAATYHRTLAHAAAAATDTYFDTCSMTAQIVHLFPPRSFTLAER